MRRRTLDRLRDEYAATLHQELAALREEMGRSWQAVVGDLHRDLEEQREAFEASETAERDALAPLFDRLAGALEDFTAALEAERRHRSGQAELFECLVRELVVASVASTSGPARVVGGSINAQVGAIDPPPIDLALLEKAPDAELAVGTPVEVRSRFRDGWSDGFDIAEIVIGTGPRRFKLTRRSDGLAVPLLFDESDLRRRMTTSS